MDTYRIYKYKVPFSADKLTSSIEMPVGACVLSVGLQGSGLDEHIVAWAEVNIDAPLEPHYFMVFPTGMDMLLNEPTRFLGTLQFQDGFVAHVFDIYE